MLYEAAPHIKKVTLFIKENIPNPSPFLAKRLEHVQAFCATHNLELRVVGGPGIIDMYDERKKYISPDQTDACLFYHDLMDGRHASHLIDLCRERGIVLCAGGISFGQIAPICYGVDTLKLREYLVEIAQTLSRGETPEKDEVIFTHSEIYAACVNARICKKMDMKTSSFAAQQFVDTLHEKSIGPAMNASERADGSFERLAKAEKEYSARAQKLFDEAYRKLNG
jgi:hypothetical protein